MSRLSRLDRLKSRFPGPRELNVGGGRTIITTSEDRHAMLVAALAEDDHPLLDAVRAGAREPEIDRFAQLLWAIIGERVPPSGDEDSPWVDDHGEVQEDPA
jgi:hypothetical protein